MTPTNGPKKDRRLRNQERLGRQRDFDAVFQAGRSAGGPLLILYGRPNDLPFNRLGLSVSRRLGGAVVRNRVKRLCREAFRLSKDDQPQGWDWIVVPRSGSRTADPRPRVGKWTRSSVRDNLLRLMWQIARRRAGGQSAGTRRTDHKHRGELDGQ